jgi:TonB family protein
VTNQERKPVVDAQTFERLLQAAYVLQEHNRRMPDNGTGSPAAKTERESDFADLAAKFAAHGGGRVSPELSADLALEIVLNEIVEQACLTTGASGAAIVLERGGEWVCRASAGGNAPQLGARLDTTAGLSGVCVKTQTVQRCDDAQNDPRADIEACRILGVRSVIVLPLLRNGELAGVFEVLSSRPSAFGERDESTLEALSERVLKNVERASEPLSTSVGAAEPAHSVMESLIAVSDAASDGNQDSRHQPLLELASEAAFSHGTNFLTLALGAVVLAYAVLLTVLVAERLGGGKAPARAQPPAAVSAPFAGAESRLTGAGSGVTGAAVSSVSPGSQSDGSRSSSTQPSASATRAGTSAPDRATVTPPPAGSLLVYENGKEVFRMLPNVDGGEATAPARNGNASTTTDGPEMQRASAVEPAGALEVSPEVAEGSLLRRVEPEYPEEARQQQIQGAVVLDVHIGQDGSVQEVTLVSGSPLLAQAATGAVKQWRFKPRLVSGRPAEMQTRITLNFRLPQ